MEEVAAESPLIACDVIGDVTDAFVDEIFALFVKSKIGTVEL